MTRVGRTVLVSCRAEVIATRRIGAFRHLTLVAPDIADVAKPGQFVSAAVGGPTSALVGRRTVPIAHASPSGTYGGTVEIIVDSDGDAGVRWIGERRAHDEVDLIGPIGRPYPLPSSAVDAIVVGVGSSAAALSWLSGQLRDRGCRIDLVLGGLDDRHLVGVVEARRIVGNVSVVLPSADEDLSSRLASAVRHLLRTGDASVVYAAGQAPDLAAVAAVAQPFGVVVQCCIDEEMPCGTGLCGSCEVPVQTKSGERHTIRCCTEGAVLRADRVRWPLYLQDLA